MKQLTEIRSFANLGFSSATRSKNDKGRPEGSRLEVSRDETTLEAGRKGGKSKLGLDDIVVDRNGDGVESGVEKKLAEGVRKARKLMGRLDEDGNGTLEGAELNKKTQKADRDGDGNVTMRELRGLMNKAIRREERFQGFDSSGDGVLSDKELANEKWAEGRDFDGDGKVTLEEFIERKPSPTGPANRQTGLDPATSEPAVDAGAPVDSAPAGSSIAPGDVFAGARLDRGAPPKVSWYRPHRQNEEPTLRISGNVTSDNFWREVALASMNVGMSPRRMTSVLQDALPKALEGLGVKLDAGQRQKLGETIRQRTDGLPRANPIPHHLHPDTTGKYLDDNPAAAGWREQHGPAFDRMLQKG
ncbi:MAG: hypothetical protein VKO21_11930 [Candidatus Sericytochromatia bacterium]|nr:hypothetical protein [Candidatus Sericytochromatia bacterium]